MLRFAKPPSETDSLKSEFSAPAQRVRHMPDGDVDLLVHAPMGVTLLDVAGFQAEAEDILGIPVDVITDGSSGLRDGSPPHRGSVEEVVIWETIRTNIPVFGQLIQTAFSNRHP